VTGFVGMTTGRILLRELDDPEYSPTEKARMKWKLSGVRGTKDQPNRSKILRSPPPTPTRPYIGGLVDPSSSSRGQTSGFISITLNERSPRR